MPTNLTLSDDVQTRPFRDRLTPRVRITLVAIVLALAIAAYLFLFMTGRFSFVFPRRLTMIGAMGIAAFAQAVGTVLFHTVTANRILTPSIMGFDAMYTLMQTLLVFFLGGEILAATDGIGKFVAQTVLMVTLATLLYRWLFSGSKSSLHVLLLVGVVLGMAFSSLSTFLQRILSPSDFDQLISRLYGRMSNADAEFFPVAFAVIVVVGILVWRRRYRLDVLLLGRDPAISLGVNHKRELTFLLVLVAILIALSTALVGPMTFFGFLVAMLAYQLTGSHEHRFVLPMAFLLGFGTLVIGQFIIQHVFYAAGYLTVIIEFVGGIAFLWILLRKGTL